MERTFTSPDFSGTVLTDVAPEMMSLLLDFMYDGTVAVSTALLNTFLEVAKRLEVRGLSDKQTEPGSEDHGSQTRKTEPISSNQTPKRKPPSPNQIRKMRPPSPNQIPKTKPLSPSPDPPKALPAHASADETVRRDNDERSSDEESFSVVTKEEHEAMDGDDEDEESGDCGVVAKQEDDHEYEYEASDQNGDDEEGSRTMSEDGGCSGRGNTRMILSSDIDITVSTRVHAS